MRRSDIIWELTNLLIAEYGGYFKKTNKFAEKLLESIESLGMQPPNEWEPENEAAE